MRIEAQTEVDRWLKPGLPEDQPEPGYEEWLAAEIAAGIAELDAGKGIPAEEVWKELGLE
ncbi:hypothetical protein ORIO_20310 (plasmid) [Cereibacter azotoformans]|uniref:hypothetical protein n=1 Tax=Cereibacter TaxID=1653176 RepID=UPI0011A9CB13|nr:MULTISPECIES: hypothetical protein [Cereibacter]ULB12150.1 hypothetical protein ORIO_20310 [Cereibacter azotoformans]